MIKQAKIITNQKMDLILKKKIKEPNHNNTAVHEQANIMNQLASSFDKLGPLSNPEELASSILTFGTKIAQLVEKIITKPGQAPIAESPSPNSNKKNNNSNNNNKRKKPEDAPEDKDGTPKKAKTEKPVDVSTTNANTNTNTANNASDTNTNPTSDTTSEKTVKKKKKLNPVTTPVTTESS